MKDYLFVKELDAATAVLDKNRETGKDRTRRQMLSIRRAAVQHLITRRAASHHGCTGSATRAMATSALTKAEQERIDAKEALEAEKSPVQRHVERMASLDKNMVWGTTAPMPDPELPDEPSEIAALDPAFTRQSPPALDGTKRVVHIRQETARPSQAPASIEEHYIISFFDEGETAEAWDNPLMGWVSGADTMASQMRPELLFRTAADAVYFAKKRGWNYIVEEPILRRGRDDDAQYQDNFLPQNVAGMVKRERTGCDHWHRPKSGASHYFRPLKYHGDGTVKQHGPTAGAEVAPHVEGYYKMR